MTRLPLPLALAAALTALTLGGCQRDRPTEEAAAPAATTPPPQTVPPTVPAPSPAVPAAADMPAQVVAIDLGTAVDGNNRITRAANTFRPDDTIYVAVATSTADPAASVPAKLGARWSKDGQPIHEQNLDVTLSGTGQTAFKIDKPSGFPPGRYRVEILLDGQPVQSREFEVAAEGNAATGGAGNG